MILDWLITWVIDFLIIWFHMALVSWCLNLHLTIRTIAGLWIFFEMIVLLVRIKGGSGK